MFIELQRIERLAQLAVEHADEVEAVREERVAREALLVDFDRGGVFLVVVQQPRQSRVRSDHRRCRFVCLPIQSLRAFLLFDSSIGQELCELNIRLGELRPQFHRRLVVRKRRVPLAGGTLHLCEVKMDVRSRVASVTSDLGRVLECELELLRRQLEILGCHCCSRFLIVTGK